MAEVQNGVETNLETAPVQEKGVENTPSTAPMTEDPEAIINALLEENAKLTRDRNNYRDATLAMKGKKDLEDLDLSSPEQLQAYIDKSLESRLLQEKQVSKEQELSSYAKELARKNKELSLALASRPAISGIAGGGGGSEHPNPENKFFSPAQENALKARWRQAGIPESKYDEMLKKVQGNLGKDA